MMDRDVSPPYNSSALLNYSHLVRITLYSSNQVPCATLCVDIEVVNAAANAKVDMGNVKQ